MGGGLADSKRRLKVARNWLLVSFVVFMFLIVVVGLTVPKIKNLGIYADHNPIIVTGDGSFSASNGVTVGSGSERDPYIIDGWSISTSDSNGIMITDTNSYIVIRNVTLVGDYYGDTKAGVIIQNASHIRIENLTVTGFQTGVLVKGAHVSPVSGIDLTRCSIYSCLDAIVIQNATDVRVELSCLTDLQRSGLAIEDCSSVEVLSVDLRGYADAFSSYYSRSTFIRPMAGISLRNTDNATIFDNLIYDGGGTSLIDSMEAIRCSNVTISGNSVRYSYINSVNISACTNLAFDNNSFTSVRVGESDNCTFVDNRVNELDLDNAADIRVARNAFSSYFGRVIAQSITRTTIEGNLEGSSFSIIARGSQNTIVDNVLSYISVGGQHITVEGNRIVSDGKTTPAGLIAQYADHLKIWNNSIFNNSLVNTQYGVSLTFCSNVSILGNNISERIWISHVTDSIVAGNIMLNASIFPFIDSSVTWNNAYPLGGNFWSQYAGADLHSGVNQNQPGPDGIGDAPYPVAPSSTDEYPLMNPAGVSDATPPLTAVTLEGYVGNRLWFTSLVNLSLSATDNIAGVAATYYRIDSTAWTAYQQAVQISDDGRHVVECYSVDHQGNIEPTRRTTVKIDTQAPESLQAAHVLYRLKDTKSAMVEVRFTDSGSGMSGYIFTTPNWYRNVQFAVPFAQNVLSNGINIIDVYARDAAGNVNSITVEFQNSLNENRDLLSSSGPYGPWFVVAIIADIGILIAAYELQHRIKPPRGRSDQGGVDKETVVDGYPKYLKRM